MPAIDPAALSRSDSISQPSTALSLKKDIANASIPAPKASKASAIAPRIDLENVYTNLKAAVGEGWPIYKETMSLFVAGEFPSFKVENCALFRKYLLRQFNRV